MTIVRSEFQKRPAWIIDTGAQSMVLVLGTDNTLFLPHWGPSGGVAAAADYLPEVPINRPSEATFLDGQPLAYPTYGMATFKEPCLVVATLTGARGVRLEFVEDSVASDLLVLVFRAALSDVRRARRHRPLGGTGQ